MARQCTQPKRLRNSTWFIEKMLLVQSVESGQELDEEQLAFLADLRVLDANAVLMANLSSYDSDILSEERAKTFEQRLNIDLSSREKLIDSQMDDMIRDKNALKQEINSLKQTISKHVKEKESLLQTFTVFKKESKEKENKYMDKEIYLEYKIKELDNIIYKVEQAFWLSLSNPNSKKLNVTQTPVEIEVPKELPKVSLVNTSFQKLKNHLARFDKVVKVRTTPDAITEGSWGFEHTKQVFKEEVIPFINSLRASFKDFENGLHGELNEVKMVFNQMEAVVE
ncbi:hypothetical protein Tco_0145139 [Tanacetum coccineum]